MTSLVRAAPSRQSRVATYISIFLIVLTIPINLAFVVSARNQLLDLGSFLAAGSLARAGRNPYGTESPLIFEVTYPELGIGGKLINLNPPISVVLFSFLGPLEPLTVAAYWRILSGCLYLMSIFALGKIVPETPSSMRYLWALSLAGFWHTLELAQIYVVLLALLVMSIMAEKHGRIVLAGILIGLIVSVKPNFIVWAVMLAAARKWRMIAGALASCAAVSLVPVLVYGPQIYGQWIAASAIDERILGMPGNSSLAGLTTRFGSFELGLALGILLILLSVVRVATRSVSSQSRIHHDLGLLLSLLASPISWSGYTILLLPAYLSRANWSLFVTTSAAIMAIPFLIPLLLFDNSRIGFVIWGWLYGWAIVLMAIDVWRELKPEQAEVAKTAEGRAM